MSSEGVLLFTNDNGGGSGSNLFDQTSFQDTVLPASNNSGLTSTVGTNPLNGYFGNDLAPRWMAKTLWIKDLIRVEDRTLWIQGRPTYKVVWHESFPGADGYLFGDVVATGTQETKNYLLTGVGDGFGVSGVIRRVQWIFRPGNNLSATAAQTVDGVSTGNLSVGGIASGDALNTYPQKSIYSLITHAATNETRDLHNYQITANQFSSLYVQGVVVYYNIPGSGIDCAPGTGYLNKSQVSPSGSSLVFPDGASSLLGGAAGIQFTSQGNYGLTSVLVPSTSSIAIGTINTNLLSLSTGTGASFPVGSAVYVPNGSTYYVGVVSNVSSDVITVGPTLPFGISNTISQVFKVGASFIIGSSLYKQSLDYQPTVQNRGMNASFTPTPDSLINQSSPYLDWRVWGFTHQFVYGLTLGSGFSTYSNGLSGVTLGLVPAGVSSFLQVDGRFSALEAEWMVGISTSLSASFVVDGLAFSSLSEGASLAPGLIRRVIFTDAGVGWHSVRMNWGGSTQVALTRLIGYRPSVSKSVTLGLLAEADIPQSFTVRTSAVGSTGLQNGLTTMAWGNIRRIYADSLPHGASWTFVQGLNLPYAAGGAQLVTDTVGRTISFQYFGTQYSIIGNPGATVGITVDGSPDVAGSTFNTWLGTGLTLGFHTVSITAQAPASFTTVISAIDFLSPVGELTNYENFTANTGYSSLLRSYNQSSEPLNSSIGDVWIQDDKARVAYQRAFGGWQRMELGQPFCYTGATNIQNMSSGVVVAALYDAIIADPFQMISYPGITTNSTVFTIPCDGNYWFGGSFDVNVAGVNQTLKSLFLQQVNGQQYRFVSQTGQSLLPGSVSGNVFIPNLKKGMQFFPTISQANVAGSGLNTIGGFDRAWFYVKRDGG